MKRFRHATWTANLKNSPEIMNDEAKALAFMNNWFDVNKDQFDYLIIKLEKGGDGNVHIQGYSYRKSQTRFETWKNLLPIGSHIESSRGTPAQNVDYISKVDETAISDVLEFGDVPVKERARTDLDDLTQMVIDGATNAEIRNEYPSQYLRFRQHINVLREEITYETFKRIQRDIKVTYLYGRTGTGKTYMIYEMYDPDDIYVVDNYGSGAFDNYRGEMVLVLDEFRGNFQAGFMLKLLDKYPLKLPARYNDKVACFTRVYIVSNIPLSDQYYNIQQHEIEIWWALKRRIHMDIALNDREDYDFVKESLDIFRPLDYNEDVIEMVATNAEEIKS